MVPNKESMEMTAPGMGKLMAQKFNGTTGYSEQQGMRKDLTAEEIADKKAERSIFPELDFTQENSSLESVVSIDGVDHYKVKTMKGDDAVYNFYSTETGLLTQTESKEDMQGQEVTNVVTYSNYQEVNGVKLPFVTKIKVGPQNLVINSTTVKVNEDVTDADFN